MVFIYRKGDIWCAIFFFTGCRIFKVGDLIKRIPAFGTRFRDLIVSPVEVVKRYGQDQIFFSIDRHDIILIGYRILGKGHGLFIRILFSMNRLSGDRKSKAQIAMTEI